MRATALLLLLLPACSDYDLHGPAKDGMGDDTAGTPADTDTDTLGLPDECEIPDAEPIEVGLSDECDVGPQTGTFTPIVEWELTGHNAYGPPIVGELDDDDGDGLVTSADTPDILIVQNDGSGLLAVDGATGSIKWTSRSVTDPLSQVAIGDLEGDGAPDIVASNGTTSIVRLRADGRPVWDTNIVSTDGRGGGTLYSALNPAIADMDGDGVAEIIAGNNILSADGDVLGTGRFGLGSCPNGSNPTYLEGSVAVPVDVDGDGLPEVVVGNAIYDINGVALYTNGLADGTVAVADFDLDGEPEYVVNSSNKVYTLETDLTPTGWSDTFNNTNYVGPIAADDLDGDGDPDFVAAGSGQLRAYTWEGTTLWTTRVQDNSGAAGPILFDFEMDGYPEVVYADEEWVRVFDGRDGSVKLESGDHSSLTLFETPAVADVDNDGHVEIVMSHGQGASGLTVFGDADNSWPSGRPVWNQHAYSITNVEDDGGIPSPAVPNWTLYNNFRSGDGGLPPSSWNDVVPEIVDTCMEECPNTLWITARVWNQGTEEVPAGLGVVVRAGSGGPVVAYATVDVAIPSGWSSDGFAIEVPAADLGSAHAVLEVDRDADLNPSLTECLEDNNTVHTEHECP